MRFRSLGEKRNACAALASAGLEPDGDLETIEAEILSEDHAATWMRTADDTTDVG